MPHGILLCCVPSREDSRDAFISNRASDLATLPAGAVVGTASLRRQAQTLHMRPDLRVVTLRGSVQTRLRRLEEGGIDATFLALAGLIRLGLTDKATALMPTNVMPSAPGQGALAITCRKEDNTTRELFAALNIPEYEIATAAERAFLEALDGSCRTPIGALGALHGNRLSFIGEVLTPDGTKRWRRTESITLGSDRRADAENLGRRLGLEIRAEAGSDYQPDKAFGW